MNDLDKLISQTNRSKLQLIHQKFGEIEDIVNSVECQTPLVGCTGCALFRGYCIKDRVSATIDGYQSWL